MSNDSPIASPVPPIKDDRPPRRLIVLIPAIHSHSRRWTPLRQKLEQESGYRPSEALWLALDHGTTVFTPGRLDDLARRLRNRINAKWLEHGGFNDVVLVGHSLGGLLARRVFLLAVGAVPGEEPSEWGRHVSRIVLLASMNRGFDPKRTLWGRVAAWLNRRARVPRLRTWDLVRGSDFLANLRIDWIKYFAGVGPAYAGPPASARENERFPAVIQLLGDRDGIVTRDDSKDVLAFPAGHYREVPDATHGDLYRLDKARDPGARYAVLRQGFLGDWDPDPVAAVPDPIRRVVILLHGIRASNVDDWVEQLAAAIQARDPAHTLVVRPTYGYFSAVQFALGSVRRKNIRFFQDAYTEFLAEHPQAEFNIIAHSNGTYLLGYSLERTPGMSFQNVVLAGSVLPQTYTWQERMRNGQIGRVRNERAKRDWPVALLCSALHGLRITDVGTGGFGGFHGAATLEIAYHTGGHGRALEPANHHYLVDFVLGERAAKPDLARQPGLFQQLSNLAPYFAWALVLALVFWIVRLAVEGEVQLLALLLGTLAAIYVLLDIL